jgi:ribosomal protein L37AE/L43A
MADFAVFYFKPEQSVPLDIHAIPRTMVPSEGTIPRCCHSIYAPDHGKALSCEACYPLRPAFQRFVVLPARHMKDEHDVFANEHAPGRCPKCNARVHFVLDDGHWECGECQTKYKGPKKNVVAETEVEVAA